MTATAWNKADGSPRYLLSNSDLTVSGCIMVTGHAVDEAANKYWAWNGLTKQWNGAAIGSENPATGTGGLDLAYISGGKFPAWACYVAAATEAALINTGATPLSSIVPSGFQTLDAALGSAAKWNSADKSSDVSLTDSDYRAFHNTSNNTWRMVRATNAIPTSSKVYWEVASSIAVGHLHFNGLANSSASLSNYPGQNLDSIGWYLSTGGIFKNGNGAYGTGGTRSVPWGLIRGTNSQSSGKWLFEVTFTTIGANGAAIGLVNSSAEKENFPGFDANGVGFTSASFSFINNVNAAPLPGTFASGASILLAVDIGAQKVWVYNSSNSKWNDDVIGNQDPETGTGGKSISALTGPFFPAFAGYDPSCVATGNFAGSFVNSSAAAAVPSFSAWDTVGLVSGDLSATDPIESFAGAGEVTTTIISGALATTDPVETLVATGEGSVLIVGAAEDPIEALSGGVGVEVTAVLTH